MKKVFVTFSRSAYQRTPAPYKAFIAATEDVPGIAISHKWFLGIGARGKKYSINAQEVNRQSLSAINDSDIFIAESSQSSTGLGLQIGEAIKKKKMTILCMRHTVKHQPVSNFLKGTRSPYLHFVYYKTPKDLTEQLANLVKNSRGYEKFEKFNFVTSRPIKEVLLSESAKRGLSASELLRSIIEEWRSKELK